MIVFLFLLRAFASGLMPAPHSTPSTKSIEWPRLFEMDFITPVGEYQSFGKLSYSVNLNTTRIFHSGGAFECQMFYNTTSACVLYFTPTGLWRYLIDDESCCLDLPNIHSTGTDWMKTAVFNGTITIGGRECYIWQNVHTYYTNGNFDNSILFLIDFL